MDKGGKLCIELLSKDSNRSYVGMKCSREIIS